MKISLYIYIYNIINGDIYRLMHDRKPTDYLVTFIVISYYLYVIREMVTRSIYFHLSVRNKTIDMKKMFMAS